MKGAVIATLVVLTLYLQSVVLSILSAVVIGLSYSVGYFLGHVFSHWYNTQIDQLMIYLTLFYGFLMVSLANDTWNHSFKISDSFSLSERIAYTFRATLRPLLLTTVSLSLPLYYLGKNFEIAPLSALSYELAYFSLGTFISVSLLMTPILALNERYIRGKLCKIDISSKISEFSCGKVWSNLVSYLRILWVIGFLAFAIVSIKKLIPSL